MFNSTHTVNYNVAVYIKKQVRSTQDKPLPRDLPSGLVNPLYISSFLYSIYMYNVGLNETGCIAQCEKVGNLRGFWVYVLLNLAFYHHTSKNFLRV